MAKKQNVSVREYLNAAGEKSTGPSPDGRVVYKLLADDGKSVLKEFVLDKNAPAEMIFMFAQFGFVTKTGNVANSVLNGEEPGTRDEAAGDIEEFLAGMSGPTPVWREPGEGRARGPKYDKAVLGFTLHAWLEAKGLAKGDAASYVERLDDKSYYAKVRAQTEVMAAYHAEMAKRGTAPAASNAENLA